VTTLERSTSRRPASRLAAGSVRVLQVTALSVLGLIASAGIANAATPAVHRVPAASTYLQQGNPFPSPPGSCNHSGPAPCPPGTSSGSNKNIPKPRPLGKKYPDPDHNPFAVHNSDDDD
jgi:hypothetical protein